MHYRIELYRRAIGEWAPFTLEPFDTKDAAESHRLEILTEYGEVFDGLRDFLRVAEFETAGDRRRRLIAAWREAFPPPVDPVDRQGEAILLALVSDEALERAVGLASAARGPTDRELAAVAAGVNEPTCV